jgi:hypothetical protein
MPITKKKIQAIQKESQEIVKKSDLTQEEQQDAAQAYQDVVLLLNTKLEEELDNFFSASLKTLREMYDVPANQILSVAKTQQERLRDLSQSIVNCLEPIKSNVYRRVAADYVKQIVDTVYDCTVFQHDTINSQHGEKLN